MSNEEVKEILYELYSNITYDIEYELNGTAEITLKNKYREALLIAISKLSSEIVKNKYEVKK